MACSSTLVWGNRSDAPGPRLCHWPGGALPHAAQDATQEDDRGYLTAFLEDNLSDAGRQITITGFEGALSSRATIERLEIADDAGHLDHAG